MILAERLVRRLSLKLFNSFFLKEAVWRLTPPRFYCYLLRFGITAKGSLSSDSRTMLRRKTTLALAISGESYALPLLAFLVILAVIFPALVASFLIIISVGLSARPHYAGVAALLLVAVGLASINVSKQIAGDWSWYVLHYQVVEYTKLSDYLGVGFGPVASEPTEPVYYALSRALSVITGADVGSLAVAVTLLIYIPIGLASYGISRTLTEKPFPIVVSTVAGMLVGITFTLSTQLVRQELAAALICLSIYTAARGKYLPTFMLLAFAIFTHNSSLVPAVGLLVAIYFHSRQARAYQWLLVLAAFFAAGQIYLAVIGNSVYAGQEDGSVSSLVIIFDLTLVLLFLARFRSPDLSASPATRLVVFAIPSFYGFALGVAGQPLPFLRMYFYVEILRALIIVLLVASFLKHGQFVLTGIGILVFSVIYLVLRIRSSPFIYDTGPFDLLLWRPLLGFT